MKHLAKLAALFCFAFALFAAPVAVFAQDSAPVKTEKKVRKPKAKAPEKIDINSATVEQLVALEGVDDRIANKIIGARPFSNKAQLKSFNILSIEAYEKIADKVVARQEKKERPDTKGSKKTKD